MVEIIGTIYRIQGYKVLIVNPRWPPKIQDGRHKFHFFDIFAAKFLESDNSHVSDNNERYLLESPGPVQKNPVNREIFEQVTFLTNYGKNS